MLERHCNFTFLDPSMMPKVQVDRGAIKFVLKGANVMSPGITSAGGRMEPFENYSHEEMFRSQADKGDHADDADTANKTRERTRGVVFPKRPIVQVTAEGKQAACAIGLLLMNPVEIVKTSSGIAIETLHFLGDGLYSILI
jgi:malignant T-cell-amplified sequence